MAESLLGRDTGVNPKLRVLSVTNELYFGGDENRLLTFAQMVDRSRFDHTVLTLKRPDPALDAKFGSMRQQYADAGVEVIDLGEQHANGTHAGANGAGPQTRARAVERSVRKVCTFLRARRIDVIDAHIGTGNLVGVVAGILTGTPRAVTTYHAERWEPSWLWWPAHQWTLGFANAIITDSEDTGHAIRRFMLRQNPRIVVVPSGITAPRSTQSVEQLRAAFGLPADPNVSIVGQIASLVPTKGQMVLLEAARTVLEARPDTAFFMVGFVRNDPEYPNRLKERARALGIADRVRIMSYPGPIADVWRVIDVHAHATLEDSLPTAILEGMSLGKPAVVTSVGGIPSVVAHNRTGLIVPPNDADALARELLSVLNNRDLARSLGSSARERYEREFTPEAMTRSLEDLFMQIARRA